MSDNGGGDWSRLVRLSGKTILTADRDEVAAKVRRAAARRLAKGKKEIDKAPATDVKNERDSNSTITAGP